MILGHNIVYNPQNHHLHGRKKPFQKIHYWRIC
jgi:hypothetical protein